MLNQEQTQILEQAIILLFRLRNEQSIDNWERERARQFGELHRPIINLKEIDSTENINDENGDEPLSDKDFKGFLKFTEKEIFKMPKPFRKIFRVDGNKAHVRKRADGRYKCSFEIRYAKKPYNKHPISASGATLEIAKARFIEKLNNYVPQDDTAPPFRKTFTVSRCIGLKTSINAKSRKILSRKILRLIRNTLKTFSKMINFRK